MSAAKTKSGGNSPAPPHKQHLQGAPIVSPANTDNLTSPRDSNKIQRPSVPNNVIKAVQQAGKNIVKTDLTVYVTDDGCKYNTVERNCKGITSNL